MEVAIASPGSQLYSGHDTIFFDIRTQIKSLVSEFPKSHFPPNAFRPILLDLCSRWLDLPELVDLSVFEAIGVVIGIYDETYPIILRYLNGSFQPDGPIAHVMRHDELAKAEGILDKTLLAYYRILRADVCIPQRFHWPLSSLVTLIETKEAAPSVRFLAIRCYALQTGMAERERESLEHSNLGGLGNVDVPVARGLRYVGDQVEPDVVDGWNLFLLEEQRIIEERARTLNQVPFIDSTSSPVLQYSDLSPHVVGVSGILLPRSQPDASTPTNLVETPTTHFALRQLALRYSQRLPTLLVSPPGAGKALMISHFARTIHPKSHRQVVSIHLSDSSIDPKSLLGSYVTSIKRPGAFDWIDGPIVAAMREGKWLVLEDIDRASDEVLGAIIPLAQSLAPVRCLGDRATVDIPGRDRVVAHDDFALFATRSANNSGTPTEFYTPRPSTFLGYQYWSEVPIPSPSTADQELILASQFPRLRGFPLGKLVSTYSMIHSVLKGCVSVRDDTSPSFRDLMKWARRVEGLFPTIESHQMSCLDNICQVDSRVHRELFMSPAVKEAIYLEAYDIFLGSSPFTVTNHSSPKSHIAKVIFEHLDISTDRLAWLLEHRVPELRVERSDSDGSVCQFSIGRATVHSRVDTSIQPLPLSGSRPFALHRPALLLLEKLSMAVHYSEPLLLVGETGTGKTTAVQYLASLANQTLTVINLSNQSEASDLMGGFKPVDARVPAMELQSRFSQLFDSTFGLGRNAEHSEFLRKAIAGSSGSVVLESTPIVATPRKKRKLDGSTSSLPSEKEWDLFVQDVSIFETQHVLAASKLAFAFIEGPLIRAVRMGHWVLLDEVNLASEETLEALVPLLSSNASSIILVEKGTLEPVPRHPSFRIFASMNPATDVGKKNLPQNIRSSFTEVWVAPPDEVRPALVAIVEQYIGKATTTDPSAVLDVAEYYESVRRLASTGQIADGSNRRPHFSMRTLARALTFASDVVSSFGLRRALWEGCWMAFNMILDEPSSLLVQRFAETYLLNGVSNKQALLAHRPSLPVPSNTNSQDEFVSVGPFYLRRGPVPPSQDSNYILTPSVQDKLVHLARIILTRRFPVLIEGPTSAGKTSSIEYLAKRTGHRFVRINNHEHTDIQEYVGTYVSDPATGKLVFQDGLLVRALRRGDWIVLDELNLAPTDVLEALNRLLDDNRELLVAETQEVVKPHPGFMLFATQNPAGIYGGRKFLSRAFRNRFLEVHFTDVPRAELETILHERSRIAPSYAQRIVAVFTELQKRRQTSRVFESKGGFATLRDLFRWATRQPTSVQELALIGYMLLAERTRREDDKLMVKEVIESVLKVVLDPSSLYMAPESSRLGVLPPTSGLTWTSSLRRAFILLATALKNHEPVLLVGETGSGKTSLTEFMARSMGRNLIMLNCHQNTEVGDLLGSQRPVRNRALLRQEACNAVLDVFERLGIAVDHSDSRDIKAYSQTLSSLLRDTKHSAHFEELHKLRQQILRVDSLFEWENGPLVKAMKTGSVFLMDEISLADDSVLERLNSVLEPSRTLLLAERGGLDIADVQVSPQPGFEIVATMNPGGDYGKKELSPALRNRFTEIWVPPLDSREDKAVIIDSSWKHSAFRSFTTPLLEFTDWIHQEIGTTAVVGMRDLLGWVSFSNTVFESTDAAISEGAIFHHAGHMTVLDGLRSLPSLQSVGHSSIRRLHEKATTQLLALVPLSTSEVAGLNNFNLSRTESRFAVGPFSVPLGPEPVALPPFSTNASTAGLNMMRILRACQIHKPILLEGSPGVGKTSLIAALAALTGHRLCRINLSDQTDVMDLFGSDLPVEGGRSGEFEWKDAGFLRALQLGEWVLLDEMNLAPQAVLEGLNSILDHRGTVFIPELGRTFLRHPRFRIFAAQNPLHQGGGRKGLPKSFLNRFIKVHIQELDSQDLLMIASEACPKLPSQRLAKMIEFIQTLHRQSICGELGVEGSPWEFNLRDLQRWLSLHERNPFPCCHDVAFEHVDILFSQRFRTQEDQSRVMSLAHAIFPFPSFDLYRRPVLSIGPTMVQIGTVLLSRQHERPFKPRHIIPHMLLRPLQAAAACMDNGWLLILTGPSGSGKTLVATTLADLRGSRLQTIPISGSMDASDLIGSFEQVDPRRRFRALANSVIAELERRASQQPYKRLDALFHLRRFASHSNLPFEPPHAFHTLRDCIGALTDSENSTLLDEIKSMEQDWHQAGALFEWIDGPLVSAVRSGSWLLLDNANLCNPAVLDRLNSLCEGKGSLALTERGLVNGEMEVLQPHPNFRLIMTVNPSRGELSRAMRNRGVEVACLPNDSIDNPSPPLSLGVQAEGVRGPSIDDAISAQLNRRGLDFGTQKVTRDIWFGGDDHVTRWGSINAYVARLPPSPYRSEALLFHLLRATSVRDRLRVVRTAAFSLSDMTNIERAWIRNALLKLFSSTAFPQSHAHILSSSELLNEWAGSQPLDLHIVAPPSGLSVAFPQFRDMLELLVRRESLFDKAEFSVSSLYRSVTSLSPNPPVIKHGVTEWISPLFQEARQWTSAFISAFSRDKTDYRLQADIRAACLFLDRLESLGKVNTAEAFNLTAIRCIVASIAEVTPIQRITPSLRIVIDNLLQLTSLKTGRSMKAIWSAFLPVSIVPASNTQALNDLVSRTELTSAEDLRRRALEALSLSTLFQPTSNQSENLTALQQDIASYISNHATLVNRPALDGDTVMFLLIQLRVFTREADPREIRDMISVATSTPGLHLLPLTYWQHLLWIHEDIHSGFSDNNAKSDPAFSMLRARNERAMISMNWMKMCWTLDGDKGKGLDGPAGFLNPVILKEVIEATFTALNLSRRIEGVTLGYISTWSDALHRQISYCFQHAQGHSRSRSQQLVSFLIQSLSLICVALPEAYSPSQFKALAAQLSRAAGDPSDLNLESVCATIRAAEDRNVEVIMTPLCEALVRSRASSSAWFSIGRAFAVFSLTVIHLYLPDAVLDPLVEIRTKNDCIRSSISRLKTCLDVDVRLERILSDNSSNTFIEDIKARINDMSEKLAPIPLPRDPDILRLNQLFDELSLFTSHVLPRLDYLLTIPAEATDLANSESSVQGLIEGFCQRLEDAYSDQRDIIWPIVWALQHCRIGLRLCRRHVALKSSTGSPDSIFRFPSIHSARHLRLLTTLPDIPSISKSEIALLQISGIVLELACSTPVQECRERLGICYDYLLSLWLKDREREQQQAAEASSIYKQRRMSGSGFNDAELEEQEFLRLFPTFSPTEDCTDTAATTQRSTPNMLVSGPSMLKLLQLHFNLFMQPSIGAVHFAARSQYQQHCRDVASHFMGSEAFFEMPDTLDLQSTPWRLSLLSDQQSTTSVEPRRPAGNFYRNPNIQKSTKPSQSYQWPDHMVLQHLLGDVDRILSLRIQSPVAMVLVYLEALISHMEDWEEYASRETSLKPLQNDLIRLIVSWRQLELNCWSQLLDAEAQNMRDGVAEWWFRLYELLIQGPLSICSGSDEPLSDITEHLARISPSLDQFMTECPVGQYEIRLDLLESFSRYGSSIIDGRQSQRDQSMLRIIRHVDSLVQHYRLSVSAVDAEIKRLREPIEKEMRDYIKLASWKDVNIHALKQSASSTHRHLHRCIRKFRDVLRTPVQSSLLPHVSFNHLISGSSEMIDTLPANQSSSLNRINASTTTTHIHGTLLKKFKDILHSDITQTASTWACAAADDLSASIISASRELSASPVPKNPKDKDKEVKNLFNRKKRALADLLKELKRIGTPQTSKHHLISKQNSRFRLLDLTMTPFGSLPQMKVLFEKSDDYLHRLVNSLETAGDTLAKHNADVPTRDLERLLSRVETTFSISFELRNQLGTVGHQFTRLSGLVDRLRPLTTDKETVTRIGPSVIPDVECLMMSLGVLSSGLRESLEVLSDITSRGSTPLPSHSVQQLQAQLDTVEELRDQLLSLRAKIYSSFIPLLLRNSNSTRYKRVREHVAATGEALKTVIHQEPMMDSFLGPILSNLEPESPAPSEANVVRSVPADEIISSLLVIVQGLRTWSKKEEWQVQYDSDGYYHRTTMSWRTFGRVARLSFIESQLTLFLCGLMPQHGKLNPVPIDPILEVFPFLDEYVRVMGIILTDFALCLKSSFKLCYVLCSLFMFLSEKGFCKPPEESSSDEQSTEGALEGTGIGEGSGANDISQEIEDESQVEGLLGEDSEPPEGLTVPESENAVEMSQDLDASLEDVERSEAGEDEESSDTTEIQEQIDDVDPTDPHAVDEKLWGDKNNQERPPDGGIDEDRSPDKNEPSDIVPKQNDQVMDERNQPREEQPEDVMSPEEGASSDDLPDPLDEQDDSGGGGKLDEHVPDADTLDLPDDLDLEPNAQEDDLQMDEDTDDEHLDPLDGDPPTENIPQQDDATMHDDTEVHNEETHAPEDAEEPQKDRDLTTNEMDEDPLHSSTDASKPENPSDEGVADDKVKPDGGDLSSNEPSAPSSHPNGAPQTGERQDMDRTGSSHGLEEHIEDNPADSQRDGAEMDLPKGMRDPPPSSDPTSFIPNPLRDLGDAVREIRRRLESILPPSEHTPKDMPSDPEQVEYTNTDEDQDMQALGPRDDGEASRLHELKIIEDERQTSPLLEMEDVAPTEPTPLVKPATSVLESPQDMMDDDTEPNGPPSNGGASQNTGRRDDISAEESIPPDDTEVEFKLRAWQTSGRPEGDINGLWRAYESLTQDLAHSLCEQLRLILEPTLATRLKGDYRTGKRLNMKKIIPYIASEFSKDKIWLRRTRPSKREYQILLALDDSKSMREGRASHLAFGTIALIIRALERLESGEVSVVKFGRDVEVVRGFDSSTSGSFGDQDGARILSSFAFSQPATNVLSLIDRSLALLSEARNRRSSSSADLWQLQLIISDGICDNHDRLHAILRKASEERVLIVFVVVDGLNDHSSSIMTMKQATYARSPNGKLDIQTRNYMDTFPFEYFIVLRNIEMLPDILSTTLKQFFERASED
ncbi:uncharacterized protein EI90DRAFT_3012262 [Cantharellus anzutake]|uniref:uncharacterized protein n=1 Tax=Cantharellus anzutake TaxID=1750568 RepID=UPI001906BF2C|nr:uncharacterized protein EI90DRAFT_3012262 [Cantharellus anzutake]KAF8340373.1 hypothetical protein EI90DRAFT_3012262 [Cantharellus anzutake]